MTDDGLPSRETLWEWARAWLETDDVDSREIRAAVLILACSAGCGPRLKRLHAHTGVPVGDVNNVSYRLRKGGIWGARWFAAPWLEDDIDEMHAVVALTLQVLVAVGDAIAFGPDAFSLRTVGYEFGVESDVPWRTMVPRRPLKVVGTRPWWIEAAA